MVIYRWVQARAGLEEGIFSFTNERTGIFTYRFFSSLSPTFTTISFTPLEVPWGWENGPNGEVEKPLMPKHIPQSGYPWIPGPF
jgi:hypothetical protein